MRLIMIGASGHGKVCAEIARLSKSYSEIIFLDDSPLVKKCGEYDVVGTSSNFYKYISGETEFFVSIGNHEHRQQIQGKIEDAGGTLATLIHPDAVISEDVCIGTGTVIMPGVVINPGTKMGTGVIINTSSSVDHGCIVGDWSHVSVGTHICGTVEIGDKCWIGAGVTVSNNIKICNEVVIGVGAVVVKNIGKSGTYVGVPAKKIKVVVKK